jgi:hypothetical protein
MEPRRKFIFYKRRRESRLTSIAGNMKATASSSLVGCAKTKIDDTRLLVALAPGSPAPAVLYQCTSPNRMLLLCFVIQFENKVAILHRHANLFHVACEMCSNSKRRARN